MTTENTNNTAVNTDDELEKEYPQMLDISDEDFEKLPVSAGITEPVTPQQNDTDGASADDTHTDDNAADDSAGTNTGEGENTSPADGATPKSKEQDDSGNTDQGQADTSNNQQTIDYETEYKKLTAPFRANGADIKINTVDEAITLMQMGANYHQKMAKLKPAMKVVKLLERHDLLDESKLSFLIDVTKKDPAAIQKLIKESGIDPHEIDVEEDVNYTPKTAPVTDSEMDLDEVLNRIETTPTYGRTLTVITKEWDTQSRATLASNPHIIEVINGHIATGIYDKVMGEVNRGRTLGKLPVGLSDLEAYKQVGDMMHNQGLLAQAPTQAKAGNENATSITPPSKKADLDRDALRKAAGAPPAKKGPSAPVVKKNLLEISDEEFEKLPANAYTKIQ